MAVCHRDAADDGTYDADEPLIGSAQKQILQMRSAIEFLLRRSIHSSVVMRCKSPDCLGCKNVRFDHMPSEIWDESHARRDSCIVPAVFLTLVLSLVQTVPTIRIGYRCQTDKACI